MKHVQNVILLNVVIILLIAGLIYGNMLDANGEMIVICLLVGVILYNLYRIFMDHSTEGFHIEDSDNVVSIVDSYPGYSKKIVDINSGEIVVWRNMGKQDHTVTANNGSFHSGVMKRGDTYSLKFTQPGVYKYHCQHQKGWMKGEVHVA